MQYNYHNTAYKLLLRVQVLVLLVFFIATKILVLHVFAKT